MDKVEHSVFMQVDEETVSATFCVADFLLVCSGHKARLHFELKAENGALMSSD